MAQPPFRSDAYEVENADAPVGPRLIQADESDGSMRFTDPRVPLGVNLAELAGLQQLNNIIVVSQTGIGASKDAFGDPITTIQAGLDAVPDGADVDAPWTVLVAPGLYVEDVYFLKDGVTLQGIGTCILRNASAVSTVRIREGVATVPRRIMFRTMRIENLTAGGACIDISSGTFASGTFTIAIVPNIGDIADVGGVTLTAIANGSVPAPGEFELGVDEATTAANLVLAINDPVNGLDAIVLATSSGTVVTVRALTDGVLGNAIAISSTVPLVIIPSGPTLTGGTAVGPGSTVGNDLIQVIDCDLVPSIAGSFTVRAAAINNLYVRGGNWTEAATGTAFDIRDCAYCNLGDVVIQGLVLNYDNTNPDLPSIGTSSYEMHGVSVVGAAGLAAGYLNVGSLEMTDCTVVGTTVYSGSSLTQRLFAFRCSFGIFTVGGLAPNLILSNCTRGVLTGGGTGIMRETRALGSAVFVAVAAVTVPFPLPQPDLAYTVLLEVEGPPITIADIPFVPSLAKTTTGFDIAFGSPHTLTINYVVTRDI